MLYKKFLKAIILATFLTPIIITLFIFLISYLTSINNDTIKVISVVDKTGYFTNSLDSSDDLKFEFINDFDLEEAKLVSKTKADYGLLYIPYYSDLDRIADSTMFISEDAPSITIISRIEGKLEKALPRDVSYDAVSDEPIHIDFMRVAQGSKINLEIPVKFINTEKSPGLKKGGVLNIVRRKVELKCPAESIHEEIVEIGIIIITPVIT